MEKDLNKKKKVKKVVEKTFDPTPQSYEDAKPLEIKLKSWHIIIMFIFACFTPITEKNSSDSEVERLNSQIHKLEKNIEDIKSTVSSEKYTNELRDIKLNNIPPKSLPFKVGEKGYGRISTGVGPLFISLLDVQKYATGYELLFKIANPHIMTISNPEINIMYGNKDKMFEEGYLMKEKKEVITQPLIPGRWNIVKIILEEAKEEDLKYINVSITTDLVSFTY